MRPISHLADRDDAIAFAAFHAFVSPALRAAARGPLRRARHAGRACAAPTGNGGCAECEATVDDLLQEGFARLRRALDGAVPRTRSGRPVREMVLICEHLASADARHEDAAARAVELRHAESGDEPWLRAARAQLVHYPLLHLEERTRRADAVRRGASARPDRDLRQAAWAAPLRDDPAGLEMLIVVVFRMRRRVPDPFHVPDDLRERHGLTWTEASRRMGTALVALRKANPGFFAANIGEPVTGRAVEPPPDPQDGLATAADREQARATLARLLTARADEPVRCAARRESYRHLVGALCTLGTGRAADPIAMALQELGVTYGQADRLVRRLATLVAAAGVEWTDRALEAPPAALGEFV
ncbi:hypothetical protein [Actinomadura chibensis]|uniref:Uncharacterized protein n=1 Tax=Actinomadura chibensis TaxID=392828 RepID=A0A5D0NM09_9ACTN|nr:hypothetical protein [Actinomadura chibensis]TYB45550.1 hypothetical protein FXF69_19170 [Actinomadura chibensis]